ncbi:putative FMN-binding split barrel, heme oxygenase HugZ-like superfamily [Helianthus annuus]|uniref:FMN-binding split barrel, heme oxygenase HugZ-like superfamily n=1 Tax=Helianthus annuus TaxID=4232 RepID=A0A251U3Y0_HELAN|nr:glutamyl-tRNA reductase-binding protein, chloroplastic [Helianthus annuus]KAF5793499.1 putative FMN-binding split barrel, heme oxygenase HugZ-like superfamily [Helianthus annuus]KAJ0528331.1 putative FMN-binding split barrel, heme oxygenase HugZ-like superfamily [Helianthus annuus]KAJ0544760.1 putative FMN-binding split barrel, heme oxygenase HugZ-like superfamily [Helianthus annuus]KAJ0895783.1 putative FMN-binding split barrel, heme oxygenase HugZ-like superfamily [Helianthus annuus]
MMLLQSTTSILPSVKLPILKLKPESERSSSSVRCSVSVAPRLQAKPSPAEVSRTIMELSSVGTFSTAQDTTCPPLALGVRFAVDPQGTPVVCLNASSYHLAADISSSLNVQSGLRTTQCTIQGTLHRPPPHPLSFFKSLWEKRFGEKADAEFIHILDVERVLQLDNFMEDAVWVTSSDYRLATPDPLRDFAHHLVHEINTHNMEDVLRFCNIYVDSDVQVSEAKMVWLDRLGFDIHLYSPENDVYEVRIPFPREVTNEKGAKSSFNGMAQLAWEVEKNYQPLEFHKIKQLKKIAAKVK